MSSKGVHRQSVHWPTSLHATVRCGLLTTELQAKYALKVTPTVWNKFSDVSVKHAVSFFESEKYANKETNENEQRGQMHSAPAP